jgi:SulP family sulfate permease
VTIFASQLKDLGGLKLPAAEPGQLLPKLAMLGQALPTISPAALAVGVGSAALIFLLRRLLPNWPGMLIAVVLASLAAWLFHLPIETIGSHFGQLPGGLPGPRMPTLSASSVLAVLPAALSFTLLGAVESLLSAKVADGMTGRKHRYNMEVVAQGVANVASAIFGGISVTGTIARTATNIRAGGVSPVSGMMHALFVLIFMVIASPLASFIPLSALAGVLVVVCWNMAEKDDFLLLLRDWRGGSVLMATFGLTLIEDLTVGIIAGCVLAAVFAAFDRIRQRRASP